ncbi:NINE protein [Motilimonas sp. 1_MG-2023]|uniref:NINE protein n=1 Tax=Motilimonas sp. 1_MG-2023 TaxID=3062672 RepID=UPI0026E4629B|nr:NINE protein [Motilimonas sp. 1_MG-2023]MDO6524102.1 NINE protein [Motilimonas sp. 1_MG-2023]
MEQVELKYKSRVASALLAIIGGSLGLHRFFLGQWWGVFYLLFSWTLIPAIVGLIEGIVFLATDQQQWNNKYNQGRQLGNEGGTVLILVMVLLPFVSVPVIGILAAISIPAYQDYTIKANAGMGHAQAQLVQAKIAAYVAQEQVLPADNEAIDVVRYPDNKAIALLDVYNGRIRVEFTPESKLTGALIYQASLNGDQVEWDCTGSTLAVKYLPPPCR